MEALSEGTMPEVIRDPRVDHRPGDVFAESAVCGDFFRRVEIIKRDRIILRWRTDAMDGWRPSWMRLNTFRKWAATAEVIRTAEESTNV